MNELPNHRLYSFVNHLYMSPIQWGIQTAHCVSTMSVEYAVDSEEYASYMQWALGNCVILVCQGGNVASLTALYEELSEICKEFKIPCVKFNEDEQSLGGVITAVSVLMPEELFNCEVHRAEDGTVYFINNQTNNITNETLNPKLHRLLSLVKLARLA